MLLLILNINNKYINLKNLKKMGCIHNTKTPDKKFTSVIVSNQLVNENNGKRNYSQPFTEQIYSKKHYEDMHQTNSSYIEELIEKNPLPFVKIKLKNNHL